MRLTHAYPNSIVGVDAHIGPYKAYSLKASLGHKGSWPEGPEGIRTPQIPKYFKISMNFKQEISPVSVFLWETETS